MWLKQLSIRGFRSFSEDSGIVFTSFSKMNLIIGSNNIGKSNLSRFMDLIRDKTHAIGTRDTQDLWQTKGSIYADMTFVKLDNPNLGTRIQLNVKSDGKTVITNNQPSEEIPVEKAVQLFRRHIKVFTDARGYVKNSINKFEAQIGGDRPSDWVFNKARHDRTWFNHYKDQMQAHLFDLLGEEVRFNVRSFNFTTKGFYIEEHGSEEEVWAAVEAAEKMNRDLKIDYIPERAEFEIQLLRNGNWKSFELRDLGMGVLQFVLLLSALYLHNDEHLNIFIEEIELNMHARALSQLIQILESHFVNHRFFLLTHSSVVLDRISGDYTVYRLERSSDGSTSASLCSNRIDLSFALDDLGMKPSQLLQSNVVIWVEGPSDKIYIKTWMERKAAMNGVGFIEGKDYSFVYYGGALLDHYRLLAEDDDNQDAHIDSFIDILKTSRYSVIVCDSDLGENRVTLKPRVLRIKKRLELMPELSRYVSLWITEGREIENYVPHGLMIEVFTKHAVRQFFKYKGERVRLHHPDPASLNHQTFNRSHSFDQFFAQLYTRKSDSKEYTDAVVRSVSDVDKVQIARSVSALWGECHFSELDLDEKMDQLIAFIRHAQQ
ncbi:ATP-dependent nuclease [Paenibacillus spiritus]|nr:AAA family ATPase [Paenibacillus spiritus]